MTPEIILGDRRYWKEDGLWYYAPLYAGAVVRRVRNVDMVYALEEITRQREAMRKAALL